MADEESGPEGSGSLGEYVAAIRGHMTAIGELLRKIEDASAPPAPLIIAALKKATDDVVIKRAGGDQSKLRNSVAQALQLDPVHQDVTEEMTRRAAEEAVPIDEHGKCDLSKVERNVRLLTRQLHTEALKGDGEFSDNERAALYEHLLLIPGASDLSNFDDTALAALRENGV